MKFDRNMFGKRWVPYAMAGTVTVIVYMVLSHLGVFAVGIKRIAGFVSPVFFGVVIAYVMTPLADFYYRKLFRRVMRPAVRHYLSVAATIGTVILGIVILLVALIPQLVDSIANFLGSLDGYALQLQKLLENISSGMDEDSAIDLSGLISSGGSMLQNLISSLPRNLNSIVNTSMNIGKSVMMLAVEFILAIYFLIDRNRLMGGIKRLLRALLPENAYLRGASFYHRCNSILLRYIACDVIDGIIVGAANFVFMMIAGMPYGALISVVVGVTNLAPTFGPVVGGVIGAFVMLMVNPWYALWFLVFTVILQTVDGYVIKPKLFGDGLGVSSVWILVAIIVGSRMFGVAGILMSIPAAAIISFIYQEGFLPWLERKKGE